MKTVFACLCCLVLGTAQTFALKGGPDFGSRVSTTGIYAGIMTPGPLSPGANSIGLFSVTIPRTGLGTGQVVIFQVGETYTGTFTGIADPDSAKLTGEIDASFPVISSTINSSGNVVTTTFLAKAAGKMQGSIRANKNLFSTAAARIVGTANIQFSLTVNNPFTQIGYIVIGFKQQSL
jgi:hypothetical protein